MSPNWDMKEPVFDWSVELARFLPSLDKQLCFYIHCASLLILFTSLSEP